MPCQARLRVLMGGKAAEARIDGALNGGPVDFPSKKDGNKQV